MMKLCQKTLPKRQLLLIMNGMPSVTQIWPAVGFQQWRYLMYIPGGGARRELIERKK